MPPKPATVKVQKKKQPEITPQNPAGFPQPGIKSQSNPQVQNWSRDLRLSDINSSSADAMPSPDKQKFTSAMFLFSLLELYFMRGVILRSVSRHIVLNLLWLEIHQLRPDFPNNSDSSTPLAHQSLTNPRLHYFSY